jgi:uncharacterized membrane protein
VDPKFKTIFSFIAPSIVFILAAIPLIFKKVPPNSAYGFRVAKTLANPEIWYKANKFGGIGVLVSGLITLITCLWLYLNQDSFSADSINTIGFSFFLIPIVISVIITLRYIRKL